MDLLATVRKEGSRGGRGEFQWSDVSGSSHRENYLGHSLMAPVGRWQKNRDLSWYAKADGDAEGDEEDAQTKAANERKEEIRRIKEAEQDALAKALGFEVTPRNANLQPLGEGGQREKGEVEKMMKIAVDDEADMGQGGEGGKGIGFGGYSGGMGSGAADANPDTRLEGTKLPERERGPRTQNKTDTDRRAKHRSGSRSRDKHRNRERKHHHRKEHRIHRHQSRERHHREKRNTSRSPSRSRSPIRERRRDRDERRRSRSPQRPRRERDLDYDRKRGDHRRY